MSALDTNPLATLRDIVSVESPFEGGEYRRLREAAQAVLAEHDRRVTELLHANNAEKDRRVAAQLEVLALSAANVTLAREVDRFRRGWGPTTKTERMQRREDVLAVRSHVSRAYEALQELNLDNYTHDDVAEANAGTVEAIGHIQEAFKVIGAVCDECAKPGPTEPELETRITGLQRQVEQLNQRNAELEVEKLRLSPTPEIADTKYGVGHFSIPEGLHADTAKLVAQFASAMATKLRKAEQKYGYTDGWRRHDWHHKLVASLLVHVEKGDPRDVAAFCAFAWHHGWSIAPPAPSYATLRSVYDTAIRLLWTGMGVLAPGNDQTLMDLAVLLLDGAVQVQLQDMPATQPLAKPPQPLTEGQA